MKRINLSKNTRSLISQVRDLFRKVDRETVRFMRITGVHCLDMCGICCAQSEVETTAVEMLPLAVELWRKNEGDIWLDRIDNANHSGRCVFYKADINIPDNGRCLIYGFRPLICRLFGFCTVKDKKGSYIYGGCKIIKEKCPKNHQKAVEIIAKEAHLSVNTDYSIRIISMGNDLSRKIVPINTAAKIALEKIGFEMEKRDKYTKGRPRVFSYAVNPDV